MSHMEIIGHLDLCGPTLIEGWLFCPNEERADICLQIYVGDRLLGDCEVNRFREDLRDAGFGDGCCGFAFSLPDDLGSADFHATRLRVLGTVLHLLPDEFTNFADNPDIVVRHDPEPAMDWH
jgi:hypothetical protein